jgi:small subunit ribosomal protein S20
MNTEIRIVRRLSKHAFTGAVLLANSAQAIKRARQAEIHRQRNASQRSNMRTSIKKVIASIAAGDRDAARQAYDKAVPVIDHAAGKGLIHANKAARHKSRLNQHIRDM